VTVSVEKVFLAWEFSPYGEARDSLESDTDPVCRIKNEFGMEIEEMKQRNFK
jgi:hypothetical protein